MAHGDALPLIHRRDTAAGAADFFPRDHWYVACQSKELGRAPLSRTLLEMPVVLFRDDGGKAHALLDRCSHRNVPLSAGKVKSGLLECPYHGWQFDGEGTCRAVPGLCGRAEAKARNVPAFATREQDGFVWFFARPDAEPDHEPYAFPHIEDPAYTVIRRSLDMDGTLDSTLENILDVPHTAFLHGGLFRTSEKKNQITAVVKRHKDRIEAEFLGEPRPEGLAARLLSPSGGVVTHFDRFIMPSIAQVEYRIGTENHLFINQTLTPIHPFKTRINAVLTFRVRLPAPVVAPFLAPLAWMILRQDAKILEQQSRWVRRFGEESFTSTEIDLLGPHIRRMLQRAVKGEEQRDDLKELRIPLLV
jgi:phenylpropionate dioxygenase-like ring-hydroxylating dioxygenase large terminal subunit